MTILRTCLLAVGVALLAEPTLPDVVSALAEEPAPVVEEANDVVATPDRESPSGEESTPASAEAAAPLLLDLEAAQRIALEKNPSLYAAAARIEQARARVRQARSLYLPQINAAYSAARTHLPGTAVRSAKDQALLAPVVSSLSGAIPLLLFNPEQGGGTAGVGFSTLAGFYAGIQARSKFDEDLESYSASLTATHIIFDGFSRHFTNAMARYGREQSEAGHREVVRLILDAVAQSFYGVQLARENVAIAKADEEFNQRLLSEARARKERGTGSKSDVLNFEVALRAAQSFRLQAEGEEQIARVALAALMGLPEARLEDTIALAPLPSENPEDLEAPDVELLLAEGTERRPDVVTGEFQVALLKAQLGQRRSTYYPQVNAFAAQEAQASDDSNFEKDDFGSTVGVQINYNLFAGGRNRASVAEARAQLDESEYLLEETRLTAAREIRQAAIDLRTAQENLVLQRTTADYVDENRNLVEKEYNAGQGSLVRLNQAQRDLVSAQARLALSRVALHSARHALQTATAETISRFEGYMPTGESVSE